ncbi:MAG: hypothetical protein ACE149_03135 [Armatimonadota bacterium]
MSRRVLTGMTLCMALAICVPAHAIVLRYAPKVGEVYKQKATMSGRMEMTMAALQQTMRGEITMDMDYSEKALSQTETTTRVQTELLGGKGQVKMAGQSQSIDMPTGKMVTDMDRRGQVVKVVEMDMPGTEQMMGPGAESLPNWSQFGALPEGDVSPKDTWTGKVTIPAGPNMPSIEMTFNCTLLDVTTFQGRNCAKIRTAFNGPFQMDLAEAEGMPPGAEGTMDATMNGSIDWYYDYDNSVYVYGEGTVGMEMTMQMAGAAGAGMPEGDIKMKMLMNIKTALQDGAAAPAE